MEHKPVVLIGNDRFETFGVAPDAFTRAGIDVLTVDAVDVEVSLPDLADVAGVVMFGGTVNVDQVAEHPHLLDVRAYAGAAVEQQVPFLGICLGSQILARALGVAVVPGPVREVGFEPVFATSQTKDDPVLSFLDGEESVMQWHEDTHALPEGATLLMTGAAIPMQAYRYGACAWGIQFHFEVDGPELAWWLEIADAEIDLQGVWGKSADQIRAEAQRFMPRQEARGRELFRRFADVVRDSASATGDRSALVDRVEDTG